MIRYGIALSAVMLLATACGGGGGDGGTTDLTGWWETQARLTGSGQLLQPAAKVQLDQVGNTVWMNGTGLTLAGANLTGADPNYTAAERVEMNLFVSSPDLIEGGWTSYSTLGEIGLDIRMIRSVPETGTFSGVGTVLGQPVNLASTVAYGRDDVWPSWFDLDIMHSDAHAPLSLWMEFNLAPPVGPGVYNVGTALGEVDVEVNRGAIGDEDATGGTVTLTTINAGRAEGNYSLTLPLGGALVGSFAVDIIIRQ